MSSGGRRGRGAVHPWQTRRVVSWYYEGALLRHLSAGQRKADVLAIIDYLCAAGKQQSIFFLWRPLLRDPNDDMVAEVAVASGASAIVTHNLRDFEAVVRFGVQVLPPAQFLLQLPKR